MIELSAQLRDHLLDGYDTAFPEGSTLTLHNDAGTVLATFNLPANAWAKSAGGMKKVSAPFTFYAMAQGIAVTYTLEAGGNVEKGSVSDKDGTGDLVLSDTGMVPGTLITLHSFSKVA